VTHIEPALSAEEWANALHPQVKRGFPEEPDDPYEIALSIGQTASWHTDFCRWPQSLALANAALPDDSPYKFTWADFDLWAGRNPEAQIVADKIRAILPPREHQ
jgi:hypothetical protein